MAYYKAGQTIELSAEFRDFNNELVDPQSVKVIFYDRNYNKINEHILGAGNRLSQGLYFYNYTIPNAIIIYYEFNGEYNGVINLDRKKIEIKFV